MKLKDIILLFVFLFLFSLLSGCSGYGIEQTDKISIVATVFPVYDFARQICGDAADVKLLLPPGTESHTYEPSAKDMIAVSNCDLFLYGGGESDNWAETILNSVGKVTVFKMMDTVQLYEEELLKGMDSSLEEDNEYDEHVWTSPANSIQIVKALIEKIIETDPKNEAFYRENGDIYLRELQTLDKDYHDFFSSLDHNIMVFGDRFPLLYFAKEFSIDCYAAFPGCSSETEPSAATIAYLIDFVKEEKISTVFYIELSNHQIADTIAESTGAKTAMFHTCHNLTAEELNSGSTYLSLMTDNLETLKGAMK